jgi:hypothetical protein
MLSRMRSARSVAGTMGQGKAPDWGPLENLLDTELCGQFMWMFAVDLQDGTRLNAYKHIWTRCYFHLADDGRAFNYVGEDRYRGVDPYTAIVSVFEDMKGSEHSAAEEEALRAALARARATRPES